MGQLQLAQQAQSFPEEEQLVCCTCVRVVVQLVLSMASLGIWYNREGLMSTMRICSTAKFVPLSVRSAGGG
jgi:hypothetical protein